MHYTYLNILTRVAPTKLVLGLHPPLTHNQKGAAVLFTMRFHAYGHENVLSLHKTTVEFTKEDHLTKRGDCILGIKADFEVPRLNLGKIEIVLEIDGLREVINAVHNPDFDSDEMVIRKSDFLDKRTFATHADKAACDVDRGIVRKLQDSAAVLNIYITTK